LIEAGSLVPTILIVLRATFEAPSARTDTVFPEVTEAPDGAA
jgi:hypothetical protein